MGGGAVFRSVVRLIGAATAAAVSYPPPAQTYSSVPSLAPVIVHGEGILYSRRPSYVVSGTDSSVANLEAESVDRDGRFSSKNGKPTASQLVFTSPPSVEEVEDATRDLHTALHLSLPASGLVPVTFSVADDDNLVADKQVMGTVARHFEAFDDFEGLGERKNNVMEAFLLLEKNPKVQDVVKSLASDPAVWNAMLNNEKLQEFANNRCSTNDQTDDEMDHQEDQTEDFSFSKFTSKVYGIVTEKLLNIFRKVVFQLNSVYGSVEKAFLSKGGFNTSDKTVVSCMMLAVAVLLMVFFKRVR